MIASEGAPVGDILRAHEDGPQHSPLVEADIYETSLKSRLASRWLHTGAGLALLVFLLWLFFRGSDFGAIRESLLSANRSLLIACLAVTMVTYLMRAFRWRILLSPLGRPTFANCFSTTVIGFMVNFLILGRLGEVARPYLLARREGFSASSAFATILLERILDLVAVVSLIGFWLLVGSLPSHSGEAVAALKLGGIAGLGGGAIALGVMFFLARHPDPSLAIASKLFHFFPRRFEARAMGFLAKFRSGFGVLLDASSLFQAAVMSIVLWVNISFAFLLGARAFGVSFGLGDAFLVIGFLTVGVALPTPGAIGGYHVMCALALTTLFGTESSVAKAVALVSHAISFLPVTFLGILMLAKAGLSFRQVKSMTRDDDEENDK